MQNRYVHSICTLDFYNNRQNGDYYLALMDIKIDHQNDGLIELKHPLVEEAPSHLLHIIYEL